MRKKIGNLLENMGDHQFVLIMALIFLILPSSGYAIFSDDVRWFTLFPLSLLSLVSAVSGGFLGFLFGLPKSAPAKSESESKETGENKENTNTNLYDISEWITKIIVGVGLVEVNKFTHYFYALTNKINADIKANSPSVCGMIIIGSAIVGFFALYFWSRINFLELIRVNKKIKETQMDVILDRADTNLRMILSGIRRLPSEIKRDKAALDKVISDHPLNMRAVLLRARYSTKASSNTAEDHAEGIRILSEFIERKKEKKQNNDQNYADALYNLACYKSLSTETLNAEEGARKSDLARQAVEHLKESISISPENKEDAKNDNDFKPIQTEQPWIDYFG